MSDLKFVIAEDLASGDVGLVISEEDLALGKGTRLDHSSAFV